MARGRSSVGNEMKHVCASCRGRRPRAGRRLTIARRTRRSGRRGARNRSRRPGSPQGANVHVVDRRVVAPCVARPSARDGLAEASLSRATSEPSAARSSKSFAARRGAAGRTAKSWPSTLACRTAVGGAGQSGGRPPNRARIWIPGRRSATSSRRSSTRRGARPWSSYPLRKLRAPRGNASSTANTTKDVTNITKTTCRARRFISSGLLSVAPRGLGSSTSVVST